MTVTRGLCPLGFRVGCGKHCFSPTLFMLEGGDVFVGDWGWLVASVLELGMLVELLGLDAVKLDDFAAVGQCLVLFVGVASLLLWC